MTWMLMDPTVNLTDPNAINELKEQQAVRRAEQAEDAKDLSKYTTLGRLANGRAMLAKLGHVEGNTLGKNTAPS